LRLAKQGVYPSPGSVLSVGHEGATYAATDKQRINEQPVDLRHSLCL
tara:strand:- start:22 stop:162 length:141 start_codon:yes stop_codon:yes gene_type:complete